MLQVVRQYAEKSARIRSPKLCKMLRQCAKTTLCLMLCCIIVFASSYKRPAKAAMTGVLLGGAAIVATCMTALGIGVSGVLPFEGYNNACQHIWDGIDDAVRQAVVATAYVVDNARAQFKASTTMLKAVFQGACNEFPQLTAPKSDAANHLMQFYNLSSISEPMAQAYRNISDVSNIRYLGDTLWQAPSFSSDGSQGVVCNLGGKEITGKMASDRDGNVPPRYISYEGFDPDDYIVLSSYKLDPTNDSGYSPFYCHNSFFSRALVPTGEVVVSIVDYGNKRNCLLVWLKNGTAFSLINPFTAAAPDIPWHGQDVFNPANDKFYADGKSVMNTKVDDVIDGISSKVGVDNPATGEREIPLTAPNVGTADDPDVRTQTQQDVLGKDVADERDRDRDRTTNKDKDTSKPKSSDIPDLSLPDMITRKFPFSIPWDLYNSVVVLASPGEAPKWTVPFVIKSIGVNESFMLDMSKFDTLAALIRWGLSLLFLISLIILTNKLIKH